MPIDLFLLKRPVQLSSKHFSINTQEKAQVNILLRNIVQLAEEFQCREEKKKNPEVKKKEFVFLDTIFF